MYQVAGVVGFKLFSALYHAFCKRLIFIAFLLTLVVSRSVFALEFTIVANPDPALPGEHINVEMIVTNDSNVTETNLNAQMIYPAGLGSINESSVIGPLVTSTSCNTSSGSTTCREGDILNWDIGSLQPGSSTILRILPTTLNSLTDGSVITFAATVSDLSGQRANNTADVFIDTAPELSLSLDEDKHPVAAGDTLTYTLRYGNRSAASVTESSLRFTLPAGTAFVSASGNGTLLNGEVTWDLNTLAVGTAAQQQVVVTVNDPLVNGTQIESSAAIDGTSNFNSTEQRASSITVVAGSAPLDISMHLDPVSASGNELVDVQLVISNTSNSNVTGVAVRMVLPQGVNSVNEGSITGPLVTATSCNVTSGTTTCRENDPLDWNLGTLVPGQVVVMSVPVWLLSTLDNAQVIPFMAVATSDGGDTAVSRNTFIVDTAPELSLSLDEDKHPVAAGDTLTYTLRYGNRSVDTVTGSQLRFPIPAGTTLIGASPGGVESNGVVTWNLGSLATENIGQQRLRVRVDNSLTNGKQIRADAMIEGSLHSSDSQAYAGSTTTIVANAPLALSLSVLNLPALPNQTLDVKIAVTNNSGVNVTGTTLQLIYPEGLDSMSESAVTGPLDSTTSCNITSGTTTCRASDPLNWNLGTLTPGQTVNATFSPDISSTILKGRLISFVAVTRAEGGVLSLQSLSLPIGDGDDTDGDGFGGIFDNCPTISNADQANYDLDALGDVCDVDDDNDLLLDAFEIQYGLNPFDASDATLDGDSDSLNNLEEQAAGTDPTDSDTDNDGLLDDVDLDPLNDHAPIADAGADQSVMEGALVNLDGSGSSDADGGGLVFKWQQTAGTNVVLDDDSAEMPGFITPDISSSEDLIFELTVTDSNGTAVMDSVTITVAENTAPNADAGADQPSGSNTILPGDTVTLNGSNSSDDFDDPEDLIYAWTETSATGVVLSDASITMPSFTVPSFGSVGGVLTFSLIVTDSLGQTDVDNVIINVSALTPPNADAGSPQQAIEGQVITLNGSNSSDPDGTVIAYQWQQTSGTAVILSDVSAEQPTFTAPAAPTTLEFELEVTDNDGLMASSMVTINVNSNPVPVCMAGPDQIVAEYDNGNLNVVMLDAGSSTISSGSINAYLWKQLSGSNVTLSTPNQAQSSFTVPEVGPGGEAFTFRVSCTSDLGSVSSEEITINVSDVNRAPVADAGTDQNVNELDTVTLEGSASFDPDGSAITSYSWALINASLGSSITLDDPSAIMPSFTAPDIDDLTGEALTFELTVGDGDLQGTDTVIVNVVRINAPPIADAGSNQTIDEGLNVSLTAAGSSDPEGMTLSYEWRQVSGTQVTLIDALTADANFVTPSVGVSGEDLVFEVEVTDDGGLMASAQVTISVENVPQDPVAVVGINQTVTEGDIVTLDGSGSGDADDNIVTYAWAQNSGETVTLTGANTSIASFEAPDVDNGNLILVFTLTVTDELGLTDSEQVTITVENTSSDNGGGSGGGCTIGNPEHLDPSLPLLAIISLVWINRRKFLK